MKQYNPVTIPNELKSVPRWVSWRADRKNGRIDKLPLDKRNINRKINSLSNCESWEEINERIFRTSGDLGLGFYPDSAKTHLVGIDLDHVFDSFGEIRFEPDQIVHELDSYTEFSPSRSGLHVWIYSSFSPKNHNGSVCEIKSRGNSYLTVTGWIYGKAKPIEERSEVLRQILEYYFPEPIEKPQEKAVPQKSAEAVPDHKIFFPPDDVQTLRKLWADPERVKLWEGSLDAYGGDHSRADIALCNYIYLCSNCNPDSIDRLFRRSALMRDKWDEVHSGDGLTYGEMTIRKAMTGRRR